MAWYGIRSCAPLVCATTGLFATTSFAHGSDPPPYDQLRPSEEPTVAVVAQSGPRLRLEWRPWVSGTVVHFTNGLVARITDLGADAIGAIIVEGETRAGDRLTVQTLTVEVAPLTIGGRLPEPLRAVVRELSETLPVVLVASPDGPAPDLSFNPGPGRLEVLWRDGGLRHELALRGSVDVGVRSVVAREAALRQLAVVANPRAFTDVRVRMEADGELAGGGDGSLNPQIPVGSDVRIRVLSERDGYLTLLNLGADGSVRVLSPNMDGQTRLRAGVEAVIPESGSALAFRVGYPTGVGVIRALVTPLPLPFQISSDGVDLPDREVWSSEVGRALGVFMDATHVRVDRDTVAPDWSTALTLYTIFDPY